MNNPAYTREWLMRQLPQQPVGPCAKQTVVAIVQAPDGQTFGGANSCRNPQGECPRADMPTGTGYELCVRVCDQTGHAEVNALRAAGEKARGATMRVYGHSYACRSCMDAARAAGILDLIVGGGFVRLNRLVPAPWGDEDRLEPVA